MGNVSETRFDWRELIGVVEQAANEYTFNDQDEANWEARIDAITPYVDFVDAIVTLHKSVTAFHERYGTATRENAVENQAKAFAQEAGEFVWKVAAGDLDGAAKEAADVLFTLIGVATLAGITREQLADAMRAIAASNDNKTVEKGWNWNARGTKVEKLEVKS